MAQFVDVIGVGTVEFPDGMSKEEMEAALKKLPSPSTQPTQAPTAAPTGAVKPSVPAPTGEPAEVDLTKPAFLAPRDRATKALQARATEARTAAAEEKANQIPFKDLYENPVNLQKITEGAIARFGKSGAPEPNETPEQYINRFSTAMRAMSSNIIDATTTQNWISGSKKEDVLKFAKAVDLFNRTPDFALWAGDERGQQGWRPIADYAKAILSDPTTLISGGAGSIVAKGITKKIAESGLKATLKTPSVVAKAATVPAIEGGSAGLQNAYEQKRNIAFADVEADELEKQLPNIADPEVKKEVEDQIGARRKLVEEGVSMKQVGAATALGATFGLVEPVALVAASKGVNKLTGSSDLTLDQVGAATKAKRQVQQNTGSPTAITKDEDANNVVVSTTNIYDGRNQLDMQGDPTAIAAMQIKNNVDKQMDLVASSVWKQMSEFAPQPGERTFDAVQRVFDNFDKIPENVKTQAFTEAGTDVENFMALLRVSDLDEDALQKLSSMYGVSTSDAARTLQSKSVISRAYNKLKELNPEAAKAVDDLFGKTDQKIGWMASAKAFIDAVDRNMITAMTTNMSTLMRNAVGVGINSTYGAVEEALESSMFNLGRRIAGKARGAPVSGDVGQGLGQSIEDGLSVWFYLGQADLASDITKYGLESNPALMSKMLATIDDGKRSDLIAPVRVLNTPAVMMDSYLRKAAFAASVDNSLRRVGTTLGDVVADNKNIPIEILRKGVDDALLFTFSKSPTDTLGSAFVKVVEATRPLSTAAVPFARFMTNAIRWTWQHYNPGFTAAGGAIDYGRGIAALKTGDDKVGQQLVQQGSEKMAKQMLGLATVAAAYAYREQNQDVPWNVYKGDDGTEYDIQYYFPMNIPFAISDWAVKFKKGNTEEFKIQKLVEAVTGYKAVGVQGEFLDTAVAAVSNAFSENNDETPFNKMGSALSDMFGQWLGRATVPLNQVSDILTAFSNNEAIPRDVYRFKGTEAPSTAEKIGRQMQKGIPFLKQELEETQPATRELAQFRDSGPLKQMTGLTILPFKNEIEREIQRLNITPQTVFSSTGDKNLDALARQVLAKEFMPTLTDFIKSEEYYKNATPEAQNRELSNRLREAQNNAKKVATAQYTEVFYKDGKVPPIDQTTFQSLNPKLRKMTIDFYKRETGKDLFQDTDPRRFRMAIEMSKALNKSPLALQKVEELGYAVGGAVGKAVLKKAVGKSAIRPMSELLQEMQQAASKAPVAPAIEETKQVLKPTAKAAPEPLPVAAKETDVPVGKTEEPDFLADVEKAESEFLPSPSAEKVEYTPEEYAAAEASMKNDMGDSIFNAMKNNDPAGFADLLEQNTFMMTGKKSSKYEDMLSQAKKESDEFTDYVDEVEYDDDGFPIEPGSTSTLQPTKPAAPKGFVKGVDSGNLNTLSGSPTATEQRKEILSNLKEIRASEFELIKADKKFAEFNDDVLATAQADYRFATGKELDTFDNAAMSKYEDMVKKYQKRYDILQEKYKDMPPIKLYHGAPSDRSAETIKKSGFFDPQTYDKYHMELHVGAPSFSKDFSLYSQSPTFGEGLPERFSYVEMPYATYEFRRVNMPIKAYGKSDLNLLARGITGSPDVVRPVSLPRGGLKETEDILLDPEKLGVNKTVGGAILKAGKEIKKEINENLNKTSAIDRTTESKTLDFEARVLQIREDMDKGISVGRKAAEAYNQMKAILKNELKRAEATSTKTGLGQRYQYSIAKKTPFEITLSRLADILEESKMQQKADNIRSFVENKKTLANIDFESTMPSEAKRAKEATDNIRKLTDKFAKGGLAKR